MSIISPVKTANPLAANAPESNDPAQRGVPRWLRHSTRFILQLLGDIAAIWTSYWLAYFIRFQWSGWTTHFPVVGEDPGWQAHARLLYVLIPLWLAIFWYSARLYTKPWRPGADRFLFIVKGGVLGCLATLSVTFIYGRLEYSRQMLLLAVPLVTVAVSISESLVLAFDRRLARFEATVPMLIIGSGRIAQLIRDNILSRHPSIAIHELTQIADPQAVVNDAQARGVSDVVMIHSPANHDKILETAEACESAGINFKMIPDLLELRLGEIQMDDTLGLPAYRIEHTSLSASHYAVKRVFDLTLSLLVLALAGIPSLLIALLIKLDSKGPVLYLQKRRGYRGQPFDAYKFRTMISDAEEKLTAVKSLNDQAGGFFKAKDDPRITRVGRWLRRYSLDELPQFINVFRGEMSVIGPRPLAQATGEMEELLREFGPTAKKRFNILPGITGLWQVSGRSDVSSQQRFALDLFYIEHWSLGLDLQIVFKTIPAMISGKGAY